MSKLRDAAQQAQQALEALGCIDSGYWHDFVEGPIAALRDALAEQPAEQEPVAWWHRKSNTFTSGNLVSNFAEWAPLYTAPQPAAVPAEDAIEAAYWDFDARHKGYGPHKTMPQSERERIRLAEVARLEQAAAVVKPADSPMPDVEPAEQVQSERMSLRRINHLLAPLELSHQTLADLGFYPTYPPGATLASHPNYSASDFPKICQTISDLAAAAAWESQETAEREAYEAAQRKEDAKREEWRAEMRRDVYGEPN